MSLTTTLGNIGGLLEAHAHMRLLVGRSMLVARKWDQAQLDDMYATAHKRGGLYGGYQSADGTTAYGAFVRKAAEAASVEPLELQQYDESQVAKINKHLAPIVNSLPDDHLPGVPSGARFGWRDSVAKYMGGK